MNRESAKNVLKNIPFIQALAAGKTIQYKAGSKWTEGTGLAFTKDPSMYRIKPEKMKVHIKVFAIVRFEDGRVFTRKTLKAAASLVAAQRKLGFTVELHSLTKDV